MLLPDLRGGGAERVFLVLAKSFAQEKIDVDLLLLKKMGPYLQDVPENIRVIPLSSGVEANLTLWEIVVSFITLIKYLRQNRIDVLLSTLTRTNIFAIIAHKMSFSRCRIVIREANTLHNVNSVLVRTLMQILYPYADQLIAISNGVRRDLLGFSRTKTGKTRVIYNPIDIKQIALLSEKSCSHSWLTKKEAPVIAAVGRLVPQKGFDTLINAFALVQEKMDARLIILGDGPLKSDLTKQIKHHCLEDRIELVGFKTNPFTFIRHADLLAMSSRWEGFGMVIIETLACGTNIVSTDCHSGPSEILDSGKYGKLVPVDDVDAMSRAIVDLLHSPHSPSVLKERAQFFSREKIAREYMEVLWPKDLP